MPTLELRQAGLPAEAQQSVGGCRIVAITAGFQPAERGSIPLTRSKQKTSDARRFFGGRASGTRTHDPLLPKQVRYQLRYGPTRRSRQSLSEKKERRQSVGVGRGIPRTGGEEIGPGKAGEGGRGTPARPGRTADPSHTGS